MAKSLCHLLMKVNHVIVAIFYIANMSFNAIHENKFLTKNSEFTVYENKLFEVTSFWLVESSILYTLTHFSQERITSWQSQLYRVLFLQKNQKSFSVARKIHLFVL